MAKKSVKIFRLVLDSTPVNIREVEGFIDRINAFARLDEVHLHKLLVAATEAVNNGIFHGNRSNPSKKVHISCRVTEHLLEFHVRDEGEGFNVTNVPSPLEEENLLSEHGRGIFLMRTLMDTVKYVKRKDGTEVVMTMHFFKP